MKELVGPEGWKPGRVSFLIERDPAPRDTILSWVVALGGRLRADLAAHRQVHRRHGNGRTLGNDHARGCQSAANDGLGLSEVQFDDLGHDVLQMLRFCFWGGVTKVKACSGLGARAGCYNQRGSATRGTIRSSEPLR